MGVFIDEVYAVWNVLGAATSSDAWSFWTPLRWISTWPIACHSFCLHWLDQIDTSGFLTQNAWLFLPVSTVWLISGVSIACRNAICRSWLHAAWTFMMAPSSLPSIGITLLTVGALIAHDGGAVVLQTSCYIRGGAQLFGGCTLMFAGLAEPKLHFLYSRQALSGSLCVLGTIMAAVAHRSASDLMVQMGVGNRSGLPARAVQLANLASLCGCVLAFHGFGGLIGVPLLSYVARYVGSALVTLVRYGVVVPFECAWYISHWFIFTVTHELLQKACRFAAYVDEFVDSYIVCMFQEIYNFAWLPIQNRLMIFFSFAFRQISFISMTLARVSRKVLTFVLDVGTRIRVLVLRWLGEALILIHDHVVQFFLWLYEHVASVAFIVRRSVSYITTIVWTCVGRVVAHVYKRVISPVARSLLRTLFCLYKSSKRVLTFVVEIFRCAFSKVRRQLRVMCELVTRRFYICLRWVIRRFLHALRALQMYLWFPMCRFFSRQLTRGWIIFWPYFGQPALQFCWRVFRVSRRLVSPSGCFVSAIAFMYNLHKLMRSTEGVSVLTVIGFAVAAYGSLSVGVLLFGRVMRRSHPRGLVRLLGAWMESAGAWLFLHLDLFLISTVLNCWRFILRTSLRALLVGATHVAGMLRWLAGKVESVLDGVVRGAWAIVRYCWTSILFPAVRLVFRTGSSVVMIIWTNPVVSVGLSIAVVAYTYQIHVGRVTAVDMKGFAVIILNVCSSALNIAKELLNVISAMVAKFLVKAKMIVDRVVAAGATLTWMATTPVAIDASRHFSSFAQRPLDLFGSPLFSKIASIVTLAHSRLALGIVVSSPTMSREEIVELTARLARTSQRVLIVPVVIATLISEFTSELAVSVAGVCTVPLAVIYFCGSLLFVCSERLGWVTTHQILLERRIMSDRTVVTGETLLEHGRGERVASPLPVVSGVAGRLFCEEGASCSICLEPLQMSPPGQSESLETSSFASRFLLNLHVENGARHGWLGGACSTYLSVAYIAIDHEPVYIDSVATKNSAWRLIVCEGSYSILLKNQRDSKTMTGFILTVNKPPHEHQRIFSSMQTVGQVLLQVDRNSRDRPEALWEFWGQNRKLSHSPSKLHIALVEVLEKETDGCSRGESLGRAAGSNALATSVLEPLLHPHNKALIATLCAKHTKDIPVVALCCGHAFHRPCIDSWLAKSSRCPLCREVVRGRAGVIFQALF